MVTGQELLKLNILRSRIWSKRPAETTFLNLWKPSETVQCNDKPWSVQKLLEYDPKIFIQVAALSLNLLVAR